MSEQMSDSEGGREREGERDGGQIASSPPLRDWVLLVGRPLPCKQETETGQKEVDEDFHHPTP